MHSRRSSKGTKNYWVCETNKCKGGRCPVGGIISHPNLLKASSEVLGLAEFDETVFQEKVEYISVPERNVLEYHMKDGTLVTKSCQNTGHKDCWTPERRAKISAQRRTKPACYNASALTGKIRCAHCGFNFRRATQPSAVLDGGKAHYWRCSEKRNGCDSVSYVKMC